MDLNELIELRKQKLEALQGIISTGEQEKRELFTSENESFNTIKAEIESIDKQIGEKRKITTKNNLIIRNTNNTMKKFNLIEAINNEVNRRSQPEEIQAVIDYAQSLYKQTGLEYKGLVIPMEMRAEILANTATAGQENIATQTWDLVAPLRGKLVGTEAGVNYISLNSKVDLPAYSGANVFWADENGDSQDGGGSFSAKSLSDKRITATIYVSKSYLNQTSASAQAFLQEDMLNALAGKINATMLGKHNHAANTPDGLYTGVAFSAHTVSGTADWDKIVDMSTSVDVANALEGNLAYIVHPTLKGKLKKTVKASGTSTYLLEGNEMNGYKVLSTTHMPKEFNSDEYGIAFGNWADMIVAQFGAIDLLVDPYSAAGKGQIKIVLNAYFDIVKRRDESFAIGSLK